MDFRQEASKPPQVWEKLWDIFHQANEMDPAERESFLQTVDPELRNEVEELLSASTNNNHSFENIVSAELGLLKEFDAKAFLEIQPDTVLAGRFRIVRELGRGGMGTVYEAYDQELASNVALKIMQQHLTADPAARDRFHREINLARKVTHPNACRIFDLFQHEELLFLTMELLPGETLREKIKSEGPLRLDDTMTIVLQVIETLSEMHRLGIVHRDLKTSNIVLVPNGNTFRAVVTDFGLAIGLPGSASFEVTQTGQILGTPQYMAPEQLKKEKVTAATDVYALGLVMYEMLTGRIPLEGESPLTIAAKRISEDTPSPRKIVPDLNRKWERVILRCLERNPKHRYQNATEVMNALANESFLAIIPFFSLRHRSRVLLTLSIFLIASLLLAYFWRTKNLQDESASTEVVAKRIWVGATGTPASAVSTDGKTLIDIDWEKANIMSIDLATKKKRLLTNGKVWFHPYDYIAHPVVTLLSPDSKRVAYSIGRESGAGSELRIVNTAGGASRTLFRTKDFWTTPLDWSSDNQFLAAHLLHNDGTVIIGLISTKDGSLRKVKQIDSTRMRKISFSPDNRYIAYDFPQDNTSANHDVFLISLKDNHERRIIAHNANDYLLGWSSDGTRILFASDRSGTNDAWSLYIKDGKSFGTPELVRKDIGQIYPMRITKDGSLYYAHLMSGMDVYSTTITNGVASIPSRIAESDVGFSSSPAFSRDGNSLIFQSSSNPLSSRWTTTQQQLVSLKIVSLQTAQVQQFFPEINSNGRTRWFPNGQSVLLRGRTEKHGSGVYLFNLKSSKASQILADSSRNWVRQYHLSPDGKFIFYLENKDGSIIQKEISNGQEKEICDDAADFDLSFDGNFLAVMRTDIYKGVNSLRIVSVKGGSNNQIYQLQMPQWISSLAWMPDGKSLIFSIGRRDLIDAPHRLWTISKNGGAAKDLGVSTEYVYDLRVHPDGKRIAIWTVTDSSEIWVMKNFLKSTM
jgi:serine/threonine protein kinase